MFNSCGRHLLCCCPAGEGQRVEFRGLFYFAFLLLFCFFMSTLEVPIYMFFCFSLLTALVSQQLITRCLLLSTFDSIHSFIKPGNVT